MSEAEEFLRLLNLERTKRGLGVLSIDPALQKAAGRKVTAIVRNDEFSHTVKGVTEEQLRAAAGYPVAARADEVICWSELTASEALASFFGSKVGMPMEPELGSCLIVAIQ